MRLHQDVKKGILSAAVGRCSHKITTCNLLEPCVARIVLTSGSPMVPTNNEEDERSPVIRGRTVPTLGAKPAARVQPMSAFLGFLLLSVLLQ